MLWPVSSLLTQHTSLQRDRELSRVAWVVRTGVFTVLTAAPTAHRGHLIGSSNPHAHTASDFIIPQPPSAPHLQGPAAGASSRPQGRGRPLSPTALSVSSRPWVWGFPLCLPSGRLTPSPGFPVLPTAMSVTHRKGMEGRPQWPRGKGPGARGQGATHRRGETAGSDWVRGRWASPPADAC